MGILNPPPERAPGLQEEVSQRQDHLGRLQQCLSHFQSLRGGRYRDPCFSSSRFRQFQTDSPLMLATPTIFPPTPPSSMAFPSASYILHLSSTGTISDISSPTFVPGRLYPKIRSDVADIPVISIRSNREIEKKIAVLFSFPPHDCGTSIYACTSDTSSDKASGIRRHRRV